RAPLGQQVAHARALERLQLAAEPGHIQRCVCPRRERYQAGGVGVLLADLLQQRERLGRDPGFVRGKEAVELWNAERIGADRGEPRLLAGAPGDALGAAVGPTVRGARECREGVELLGVVAWREHERGVIVE